MNKNIYIELEKRRDSESEEKNWEQEGVKYAFDNFSFQYFENQALLQVGSIVKQYSSQENWCKTLVGRFFPQQSLCIGATSIF